MSSLSFKVSRGLSSRTAPSAKIAGKPGSKYIYRISSAPALDGVSYRQSMVCRAKSGGGVAEKTTTKLPGSETKKKLPPMYKLMLHNDNYNRREYVVQILIKVVENYTVDDAMLVMEEAHISGVAMVIACAQDVAEGYCENLRLNGLTASIEPGC
jgi:ATP-dependent Clp protease adaptor protein ClpS